MQMLDKKSDSDNSTGAAPPIHTPMTKCPIERRGIIITRPYLMTYYFA